MEIPCLGRERDKGGRGISGRKGDKKTSDKERRQEEERRERDSGRERERSLPFRQSCLEDSLSTTGEEGGSRLKGESVPHEQQQLKMGHIQIYNRGGREEGEGEGEEGGRREGGVGRKKMR